MKAVPGILPTLLEMIYFFSTPTIDVEPKKRSHSLEWLLSMLALPIFPGRLQPSIVGRSELNFRVRDGNGWTLALISTNCCIATASLQ